MAKSSNSLQAAYQLARERYAACGVDVDRALKQLREIPVSLHCWQGDDVDGFEAGGGALGDGLAGPAITLARRSANPASPTSGFPMA